MSGWEIAMDEREDLGAESAREATGSWTEAAERTLPSEQEVRRRTREATEKLRQAKEKVTEAYDRTADSAARAYREARGYAQEHPDVAAAVSFAVGMGVGVMIAGRSGRSYGNGRSYARGLVPVFAIALAQAVLDVFDAGH
jgi:ElaB/YqjD/DUF883 family membrane-anchored ribosome-binding protein